MSAQRKSYFYTLLVIVFWSTVPTAFKISLRHTSIAVLLLVSTMVACVVLFLWLLFSDSLNRFQSLTRRDILHSALLGLLNPFFYYLVVFKAYSLLPAQQAQPLNMTWGIVLVLVSIPVLKQKISWLDLVAVIISFLGVWVISTRGDVSSLQIDNPLGVSLAVGSSLIWTTYWILNIKDRQDPLVRLFLNFSFALCYISLTVLFLSPGRLGSLPGLLGAVYIGIFEMGLTYALWLKALKLARTTASVTILIYLVPFLSFIFVALILRETIMFSSVAGAILIVGGILLNKGREILRKPGKGPAPGVFRT